MHRKINPTIKVSSTLLLNNIIVHVPRQQQALWSVHGKCTNSCTGHRPGLLNLPPYKIKYIQYLEYNISVIRSVFLLFLLLFTCLFPTEFLDINKYPHKFWNSKRWMCVVQLNSNLTNKLIIIKLLPEMIIIIM